MQQADGGVAHARWLVRGDRGGDDHQRSLARLAWPFDGGCLQQVRPAVGPTPTERDRRIVDDSGGNGPGFCWGKGLRRERADEGMEEAASGGAFREADEQS